MSHKIRKIGGLNARSLGNDDTLLLLARQVSDLDIDVLSITETKRMQETYSYAGSHVGYFGDFDKIGGIGFLIKCEPSKYVTDVRFVGIRLGRIDFVVDGIKTTVVCAYSPTNDDKYHKDVITFYRDLEALINSKVYDKLFICNDFNGHIPVSTRHRGAVNSFTPDDGTSNRNGELLTQFAESYDLRILNRSFLKRRNMKWTWQSTNLQNTRTEIDYILTDKFTAKGCRNLEVKSKT
uniref:Endo/exonuclease/phosphatase domain-containing protein n=1 Tax=Rhabditophanes sp. KR3021 TaxID=114890 RepID=A0AC35TTD4_9BILA